MDPVIFQIVALASASGAAVLGALAWRRARSGSADAAAAVAAELGPSDAAPRGPLRALVAPIAARLRPDSQQELERLVTRLQRAGRRGRDEVDRFLEEKVFFALGGLALGMALGALAKGGTGFLLFLACVILGLLAPEKLLDARGAERRDSVAKGLPGSVDLLVTCLDAGLSLEQAIARVARDLAHASPILAEELRLTATEFDAGVALPDALRRLARRVGHDELSALCGVVAQAHALGAPIANTLREYAISSRRQRMAMLEEKAGKLSTQLTIPLALCLLPAALLVILGPAAIQLVKALK